MFEPENELGVIVVFSQQSDRHGFQVKMIRAAFPDAIIEKDGIEYRAEFEFIASSFDQHGHDHRKCDLIICWENDCPDNVLPILALSDEAWAVTDLTLPTDTERAAHYWQRRALRAERSLKVERALRAVENGSADKEFKTKKEHIQYLLDTEPGITPTELIMRTGASASYVSELTNLFGQMTTETKGENDGTE